MVCASSWGSCLPFYPFLLPFVARYVHLPEGLVSLCWMVCLLSRGSCLPLSPILSLEGMALGDIYRHFAFLRSCLSCLLPCLSLSPLLSPFVVCPPSRGLVFLVSSCPILNVFLLVSLSRMVRPSSPLSRIVCVSSSCFCWMAFFLFCPVALSPLFPSLSTSVSLFLFPFVESGLILHFIDALEILNTYFYPEVARALRSFWLRDWEWYHLSLSSSDVFITSNLTFLCWLIRVFGSRYLRPHRMFSSSFCAV